MSNSISTLIKNILSSIPYDDIKNNTIIEHKATIWKELLDFLSHEGDENHFNHYPLWESDFEENSLFDIIDNNCDLDDIDISSLKIDNIEDGIWNESLQTLINTFINDFKNVNPNDYIKAGFPFIFNDIFKANAGNSFEEDGEWVKAWKNIDEQSYSDVRSNDKVNTVLTSDKNLQFTRKDSENNKPWIRLIMPKYTRRVEVEDLNRDFWVIGQTISSISLFLFGEDNFLEKMFNGIFNELVQLWENIMYLWAELNLLSQEEYPIKILYIPLPNDTLQPYMKYDNFNISNALSDKANITNMVKDRCEYLKDKYPKNNLVVVPFFRQGNYQKNYYMKQVYPCILFCNRYKTKEWTCINLLMPKDSNLHRGELFSINVSPYKNKIYAIKENQNGYSYCAPYSKIDNYFTDTNSRYYGLIRVIPEIKASYNNEKNQIEIDTFKLNLYDAAKKVVDSGISQIDRYELPVTAEINSNSTITSISLNSTAPWAEHNDITANISGNLAIKDAHDSYYMGELISDFKTPSSEPAPEPDSDTVFVHEEQLEFKTVKIGDFYPASLVQGEPADYKDDFVLITSNKPTDRYNIATYGIGAYHNKHKSSNGLFRDQRLWFISYYDMKKYSAFNVTKAHLREWGEQYITKLIKDKVIKTSDLPMAIATKIGVGYWTGASGSQWSHGLVCNLFYVDKEKNVILLNQINLFDGYWTNNEEIFSWYNGSRWRRLEIKGNIVKTTTTVNGQVEDISYSVGEGSITWYDHNEEIQGRPQRMEDRPHCKIGLNANKKFEYSNFVNPIDRNNLKFINIINTSTQIEGRTDHIFSKDANNLSPYTQSCYIYGGTHKPDKDQLSLAPGHSEEATLYLDTLRD